MTPRAYERARDEFQHGLFKSAAERLRALKQRSECEEVLFAALLIRLGEFGVAANLLAPLTGSTDDEVRARALSLRGEIEATCGRVAKGLHDFQAAVDLAVRAELPEVACAARLDEFAMMCALGAQFDSSNRYEDLRRELLRFGHPSQVAEYHIHAAAYHVSSGDFSVAAVHLELAEAQLKDNPNPHLEASLAVSAAGRALLESDFDTAIIVLQKALRHATQSGALWDRVAILAALAETYLCAGRLSDVRSPLTVAESLAPQLMLPRVALMDTRARLLLLEGDHAEGRRLSQEVAESLSSDPVLARSWYRVATLQTQIRIAAAENDWSSVRGYAEHGRILAAERKDKVFETLFCAYVAECDALQGQPAHARDYLASTITRFPFAPPSLALANLRSYAALLSVTGRVQDAKRPLLAALETARATRDVLAVWELENTAKTVGIELSTLTRSAVSLSFADLIESVDQPRVLSERLYHHLHQHSSGMRLGVYRATGSSIEVADSFGMSPDEVRDVVKRPQEGFEIVIVGESASRTYALVVSTPTTVEDARELMTVRRLAAAAIALQKARDEAKSRESIWSDREIAVASGGIYLAPAMLELLDTARRIAPLNVAVLLTGETGVGKEVVARTIHDSSNRAAKPFIPFNCSAVPRDMVESQLFGYRRGAFTGAHENFSGVIRAASGGTVFLDEIGDLPPDIQPKLLRFLETAEVHPLGEPEPIKVDVRVIAATNVDLESLVAQGRFRTDLYYRLNVVPIQVPPLRDRREEVPALANLYLRRYADEFDRGVLTFTPETLEMLVTYRWPGNVRQLANEIRRVAALARADSAITPAMLSRDIVKTTAAALPAATRPVLATEPAKLPISLDQALGDAVDSLEAAMIRRALAKAGGHVDGAAQILGISRKGLFLKRRRLGIAAPES